MMGYLHFIANIPVKASAGYITQQTLRIGDAAASLGD